MQAFSAVAVDASTPRAGGLGLARLSDEALAKHAARGRSHAFEAVYERYHQPLFQYCRSILRHDADAQDALQSTFTKALAALQKGQRNAPLRPWLYRIAHNESISIIRARKRTQSPEPVEELLGSVQSAEEEVGARERWLLLMRDLGELAEKPRGALLMRELNGLSHEEIGVALGTSTGGAKQLIFDARQALAEFAEGREMGCDEVRRRISDGDRRVLRGRKMRAHLRGCEGCAAFADGIGERTAQLRAMAPVLAPAAAAELFGRVLSSSAGHAASGASAATPATAAATGAKSLLGGAAAWKAVAGAVLVAGTAVGVGQLAHRAHHPSTSGALHRATVAPVRSGSGVSRSSGPAARSKTFSQRGRLHAAGKIRAGLRGQPIAPSSHAQAPAALLGLPAASSPRSTAGSTRGASAPGRQVSATHHSGSSTGSGHSHAGGRGTSRGHHGSSTSHGQSGSSTGHGGGSHGNSSHTTTTTTSTSRGKGSHGSAPASSSTSTSSGTTSGASHGKAHTH
jgi:RNA polymerase sigma factor (sigma-70 family)